MRRDSQQQRHLCSLYAKAWRMVGSNQPMMPIWTAAGPVCLENIARVFDSKAAKDWLAAAGEEGLPSLLGGQQFCRSGLHSSFSHAHTGSSPSCEGGGAGRQSEGTQAVPHVEPRPLLCLSQQAFLTDPGPEPVTATVVFAYAMAARSWLWQGTGPHPVHPAEAARGPPDPHIPGPHAAR